MKSNTHRFHLVLSDRHWESLYSLSLQTQLSVSDVLRSMVEHGLSSQRVNETYPSMSGQIKIGV